MLVLDMVAKQTLAFRRFSLAFIASVVVLLSLIMPVIVNSGTALADKVCANGLEVRDDTCVDKDGNVSPNIRPTEAPEQDVVKGKPETCGVEKIGWLICPVIEISAKISDKAFRFLSDNFLRTDPALFSDNSGTKTAWELSRNLANIMFIIAFLVIVASQVTGFGISNYGIKKMLPRLIVAAIAVNVSYFICQLIVDLTNIMGYEIHTALLQIADTIGPSVFGQASQFGGTEHSTALGTGLTVIAVGALAAGAIVYLIMGPLMSVIVMVLVTVLTIIVILLLRKALIVLLIVISPIAFVLYLLPNTEKYFNKWLHMFIQLLMVFPVVALLLGGGKLAGTIILVSGSYTNPGQVTAAETCNPNDRTQDKNYTPPAGVETACGFGAVIYDSTENGDTTCANGKCSVTASWQLGLIATGVTVIPLFAVYSVLQGALSAAGSIGGKIQTLSNGARNALKKRAKNSDEARQTSLANRYASSGGGPVGSIYRRRNRRDAKRAGVQRELNRNQQEYIAGEIVGDEKFAQKVAGSKDPAAIARAQAAAAGVLNATENEEIKNAKAMHISIAGDVDALGDKFEEAVRRGDAAAAKGLQEMLFEAGESGADRFIKKVENLEMGGQGHSSTMTDVQKHIAANQGGVKSSNAGVYYWATDHATGKDIGHESFSNESIVEKLTDSQIATQSKSSLSSLAPAISSARAASIIKNDSVMQATKGKQQEILRGIAGSSGGSAGGSSGNSGTGVGA